MAARLSKSVPDDIGERLHALVRELYPINRSITGQGVRDSLGVVARVLPLEVSAVPTGTQVFDWTVPREWNLRHAYIESLDGARIIDSARHNLHVVGYSVPVDRELSLAELIPHLHTLPEHPDWIPYRTSYYRETWGFCLSQRQFEGLKDQRYRVRIDSTLEPGVLNFAEAVVAGERDEEILISAHICHPSLANDNLSGIAIVAWLGCELQRQRPRYTYRFLFAPGTIGAIAWAANRVEARRRTKCGIVAALLGHPSPLCYKRTRSGHALVDMAAAHMLRHRHRDELVLEFAPWGYDERQFNSPGLALDVGRLTRATEGGYPEYHTSADSLELVTPAVLDDSYRAFCSLIDIMDNDCRYQNLKPYGEPQLGKYGLYDSLGGAGSVEIDRLALLWTLNLSDGSQSLLEIAERSGLPFGDIHLAASALEAAGLLGPPSSNEPVVEC